MVQLLMSLVIWLSVLVVLNNYRVSCIRETRAKPEHWVVFVPIYYIMQDDRRLPVNLSIAIYNDDDVVDDYSLEMIQMSYPRLHFQGKITGRMLLKKLKEANIKYS